MALTSLADLSIVDANNTSFSGITQAENSMLPSNVNDAFRATDGSIARYLSDLAGINQTVGGTANAITVTVAQTWTALANGQRMAIKNTVGPNTGATTIAVTNSVAGALGTKAIRLQGDSALVGGEMLANGIYEFRYDTSYNAAAGAWVLLNSPSAPNPLSLSGSTVGYTPIQLISTEAAAAAGPILDLYRDSASPAISDVLGEIDFNGRDSGAGKQLYASISAQIANATAGNENGILRFATVIAGAVTIQASFGGNSGAGTGGFAIGSGINAQGAGTVNAGVGYYLNGSFGVIGQGTLSTATGGTAISYTSVIPSGAKRFTLSLSGLSTSGSSLVIVQLGVGGTYQTTTYLGDTARISVGTATSLQWSSGVALQTSTAATDTVGGSVIGELIDAVNGIWSLRYINGQSNSTVLTLGAGSKNLAGILDSVRLTTAGGTDTFDANTGVNLTWE